MPRVGGASEGGEGRLTSENFSNSQTNAILGIFPSIDPSDFEVLYFWVWAHLCPEELAELSFPSLARLGEPPRDEGEVGAVRQRLGRRDPEQLQEMSLCFSTGGGRKNKLFFFSLPSV